MSLENLTAVFMEQFAAPSAEVSAQQLASKLVENSLSIEQHNRVILRNVMLEQQNFQIGETSGKEIGEYEACKSGEIGAGNELASKLNTPELSNKEINAESLEQASINIDNFVKDYLDDFIENVQESQTSELSLGNSNNLVYQNDFSQDGLFDYKNNLNVEGNVKEDMNYIQGQTHESCALMAQEQFINRVYDEHIPEAAMENYARSIGVYGEDGTPLRFTATMLDECGISYEKCFNQTIDNLDSSVAMGRDSIICVDARLYYEDASIVPNSGHAVTVCGRGVDDVGNVKGYYLTDSNTPGAVRFLSTERLEACWNRDMVTITDNRAYHGLTAIA